MNTYRCGIYSFPKSGNTWMREIVRGLFNSNKNTNEAIPDIYQDGINGQLLSNNNNEQWSFYKSHSSKELLKYNNNSVENDLIIYIVRNPFDVFCSQLNYLLRGFDPSRGGIQVKCESIDQAKENGLIDDFFSSFLVYGTLMPYFKDARSWMENVTYWVEKSQSDNRIIIIKYEDMIDDLEQAMQPIITRVGMDHNSLSSGIETASSRTNDGGKFFWKKKSGTFKEYLESKHIKKFISTHEKTLTLCGYNFE